MCDKKEIISTVVADFSTGYALAKHKGDNYIKVESGLDAALSNCYVTDEGTIVVASKVIVETIADKDATSGRKTLVSLFFTVDLASYIINDAGDKFALIKPVGSRPPCGN